MHIPNQLVEQTIDAMSDDFDSHEVIKRLMQDHQRAYAEALVAVKGDRLFHQLHSDIGRQIATICQNRGYSRFQSRSDDIFEQKSKCIGWVKA